MEETLEEMCPICHEDKYSAYAVIQCNHKICSSCLERHLNTDVFPKKCPICRALITRFTIRIIEDDLKFIVLTICTKNAEKLGLTMACQE